MFHIGTIIGVHGIKGEVKLRCLYADLPWSEIKSLVLANKTFHIATCRPHQENILIKFAEVPDRNMAETMRQIEVYLSDEQAKDLDMSFAETILDKPVQDIHGKDLGVVTDIIQTPAHDVLVITQHNRELLVPHVPQFVKSLEGPIIIDRTHLEEYNG